MDTFVKTEWTSNIAMVHQRFYHHGQLKNTLKLLQIQIVLLKLSPVLYNEKLFNIFNNQLFVRSKKKGIQCTLNVI